MTFERLRPADWVVFVAALALLFTTAPDWYSTTRGEEARQIQKNAGGGGQAEQEVEQDAGVLAESQERNAWQEDALLDRIILIALLATSALGVFAAFWRASGRGSDGLGPFGLTGLAAVYHRPARAVPDHPGTRIRRDDDREDRRPARARRPGGDGLRLRDRDAGARAGPGRMSLEPGIERTDEFTAEGALLTDVRGTLPVKVLSTPGMIAMMERCASILSWDNLEEGKATVGFEVCVKHVAVRPRGRQLHGHGDAARGRGRPQAPLRRRGARRRAHNRRGHARAPRDRPLELRLARGHDLQSAAMIDRDQVLYVAKLARLKVTDDEVDRIAEELSKILEHVETMNELDLEGVEPTSHVVDLTNVLREDVPRPGLSRERALEQAPDAADGGFRVPSPGAS